MWFAGQRDHDEALRLVADADLFVLNSTYEGFPHVVLEAQLVGTAVVATDAGGTSEAIVDGETGRLVPVNDGRLLASAMLTLLRNTTLRRRLTDRARDSVRDYSWDRVARETLTVLTFPFTIAYRRPDEISVGAGKVGEMPRMPEVVEIDPVTRQRSGPGGAGEG